MFVRRRGQGSQDARRDARYTSARRFKLADADACDHARVWGARDAASAGVVSVTPAPFTGQLERHRFDRTGVDAHVDGWLSRATADSQVTAAVDDTEN
jgi:hypothetical protein